MLQDRRQYPRVVPGSPLLVDLDEYTVRLSDLGEGGLAVDGIFPKIQRQVFSLALNLPESNSPIRALAQTAWTSDSENRTGVSFVHLPASSRQQLNQWISAQMADSASWRSSRALRAFGNDAQFNFAAIRRQLTSGVNRTGQDDVQPKGGLRSLIGICLTGLAFCSALAVLGYYMATRSNLRSGRIPVPSATLSSSSSAAAKVDSTEPSSAKNSSLYTASLDVPGFVLQVGAMTHEANADGLSQTLQKNGYPAFVFKRDTDRFYKVAVGSFADAESAASVKRQLDERGFKAILVRWSPE